MAEFKTDIEIAQSTEMLPITEIAKTAGIDDKYLEQYGKYKAKVDYGILRDIEKPDGLTISTLNSTESIRQRSITVFSGILRSRTESLSL